MQEYIVILAHRREWWGGYEYLPGTPRGCAIYVEKGGFAALFCKTFGAGADIYVGDEARERRACFLPERIHVFTSDIEAEAAIPPALGGSAFYDGYLHRSHGHHGEFSPWYFDHEVMTPDLVLARAFRTLQGRDVRLSEEEADLIPWRAAQIRAEKERAEEAAEFSRQVAACAKSWRRLS